MRTEAAIDEQTRCRLGNDGNNLRIEIVRCSRARAHQIRQRIMAVADERMIGGRVGLFDVLEGHDRKIEQPVTLQVGFFHAEGDHSVRGVVGEILVGDLGEGAVTDDDQPRWLRLHAPQPPSDSDTASHSRVGRATGGPFPRAGPAPIPPWTSDSSRRLASYIPLPSGAETMEPWDHFPASRGHGRGGGDPGIPAIG